MGELTFNKVFRGLASSVKPKHVIIGLTTLGKSKSESFEGNGTKFQILADLADNGASSIREIANRTGIDDSKVKVVVKTLLREGMVRKMDAGDE